MTRLKEFLKALSDKGAKTYYVGGYVRDMILGKEFGRVQSYSYTFLNYSHILTSFPF